MVTQYSLAVQDTLTLPESLAAALLAAALAALGFAAKQILEWIISISTARKARRAKLKTLLALLDGSKAVFNAQAVLRNHLLEMLRLRVPDLDTAEGYEAVFAREFPTFTDQERKLHDIIRGYTVSGLKPLNESMLQWLQSDTEFRLTRSRKSSLKQLAHQLSALEPHLLMWLAKYATWIPDIPAHALVYLGDEEAHGVPFPKNIEDTIRVVLGVSKAQALQKPEA